MKFGKYCEQSTMYFFPQIRNIRKVDDTLLLGREEILLQILPLITLRMLHILKVRSFTSLLSFSKNISKQAKYVLSYVIFMIN